MSKIYDKIRAKQSKVDNPSELVAFGGFYRDNLDDGFNIVIYKSDEPAAGFLDYMSKVIKDMSDREISLINQGKTIDSISTNRQETINNIKQQLKDVIINFNQLVFNSPTRPLTAKCQIDLTNPDIMQCVIVALNDIYVLQALGEIANDNYNGMYYMYCKDNTLAKAA